MQLLEFFEGLDMPHPERPPMVLVDNSALNEYNAKEGGRADGPQTHSLGLCLLESTYYMDSGSVSKKVTPRASTSPRVR